MTIGAALPAAAGGGAAAAGELPPSGSALLWPTSVSVATLVAGDRTVAVAVAEAAPVAP